MAILATIPIHRGREVYDDDDAASSSTRQVFRRKILESIRQAGVVGHGFNNLFWMCLKRSGHFPFELARSSRNAGNVGFFAWFGAYDSNVYALAARGIRT